MDRELLDDKRIHKRDDLVKPADDKNIQQEQAEKTIENGQSKKEIDHLLGVLTKTIEQYFPEFNLWLEQLTDLRDQELIEYNRSTIVWMQLLGLLTRRGSRNKLNKQMRTDIGGVNLRQISRQDDLTNVPHGDTLEYFNLRAKEEEFEDILVKMIKRLIRSRVFDKYRLQGKYYRIAVDMVHCYTFDYKHCKHCLCKTDEKTQKKQWQHYKIQVSLVTPEGLSLPILSEWVENRKECREEFNKQDCEPKAFYRAAKRLREYFPRLEICLLLDGLYAIEPVFKILRELNLEWIIVLKEGRCPKIYNWLKEWKERFGKENILVKRKEKVIPLREARNHQERLQRSKPEYKTIKVVTETTYTWMRDVEYYLDNRKFNIMSCLEKKDGKTNCNYVWLVSDGIRLTKETVSELADKGGRCRWKQENEGFNVEKNLGYGLEHQYSRDPESMKIWNRIIDIAHFINQLIENGSLIAKKVFGSLRNISETMYEHFKYFIFKKPYSRAKIQIRLFPDTS